MTALGSTGASEVASALGGVNWWQFAAATLTIVVGWILGVLARRAVRGLLTRAPSISPALVEVIARFTKYAIILLSVGVAFAFLGANMQPLLAIAIIVAVVLVLMLRGVADNFAAGVLIQSRHTVKPGDRLEFEAPGGLTIGTVKEINARSVIVLTLDGRTAHIPSAALVNQTIVNHSTHGTRRSEVEVRVSREGIGIHELLEKLVTVTGAVEGVHARPGTEAVPTTITPVRLSATLRFWHHPAHRVEVTAHVVRSVADALESAGLQATVTSADGFGPVIPADPL